MYEVKFKNKNKSVMVQKGESILSKCNDEGLDIPCLLYTSDAADE